MIRPVPRRPRPRRSRKPLFAAAALALGGLCVAIACAGPELTEREKQVKADLEALRDAITRYVPSHQGRAPDELADLLSRGGETRGFLVDDELPQDPWERPYLYHPPSGTEPYNIRCLGRDGLEGGTGEDADIDLNMIRSRQI